MPLGRREPCARCASVESEDDASAVAGASKFGFEAPTLDTFDAWSENAENWKKWEEFMSGPKLDLWIEGKL